MDWSTVEQIFDRNGYILSVGDNKLRTEVTQGRSLAKIVVIKESRSICEHEDERSETG